ncbi:MAG: 2-amino-4-hydroxy-6-hydroxymethyldihydropteridine diphosphokinase [Sphingomonadaceae bacterium]
MHHYVIALGSNRRHGSHGSPARVIDAATRRLPIIALSRTIHSRPIGPSSRAYANAVAIIATDQSPPLLLATLKSIERAFGRRAGQRWGARVLDLDIILWSGGICTERTLSIPHLAFRTRSFVLGPLAQIAPTWRDPLSHLTVKQLKARLDRSHPRA